jgi:hypothetical protein
MNIYSVSVWNLEKTYAKSEEEAVKIIRQEFYNGAYRGRDFEYDDAELAEGEVNDERLVAWNLCKNGAPYPKQINPYENMVEANGSDEAEEEHSVMTICTVLVEAEDEEEAMCNASDTFHYINKDEFEIRISG